MSGYRPSWDNQFRETDWERQERWRKTREKRRAEGKCWQCAKPVLECTCPNVKHTPPAEQSR